MILKHWYEAAKLHGTVYYVREDKSRTNMSGAYSLYTIVHSDKGARETRLERAWPDSGEGYDDKLAKFLGFRLSKRAWHRNGCGYNRVRAILDDIACHAAGANGQHSGGISLESLHAEG